MGTRVGVMVRRVLLLLMALGFAAPAAFAQAQCFIDGQMKDCIPVKFPDWKYGYMGPRQFLCSKPFCRTWEEAAQNAFLDYQYPNACPNNVMTSIGDEYGFAYYAGNVLKGSVRNMHWDEYSRIGVPQCINKVDQAVGLFRSRDYACPAGWFFQYRFGLADMNDGVCVRDRAAMCPYEADPVSLMSGAEVYRESDLTFPGSMLEWSRQYNSAPGSWTANAFSKVGVGMDNWSSNYDYALKIGGTAGSRRFILEKTDGSTGRFIESGAVISAETGESDALTTLPDGRFAYDEVAGRRLIFAATGELNSIASRNGEIVTLVRTGVRVTAAVSSNGRRLDVQLDTDGRVGRVNASDGRWVEYSYDHYGNMTRVAFDTGAQRTMTYGTDPGKSWLHTVVDEAGNAIVNLTYDLSGRVITAHRGLGYDQHSFVYSGNVGNHSQVRTTGPLGALTTRNFGNAAGIRRQTSSSQPCPSCGGNSTAAITYDAAGNVATKTDFRGTVTWFRHAAPRNLEQSRIETQNKDTTPASFRSDERKIDTVWHATWRVPVERRTYYCSAPNTTAQPCNTEANARWVLEALVKYAVNDRGQVTASCQVDPANAQAQAYGCGTNDIAPAGVRQTSTDYCDSNESDYNSASCPFEGYVKTVDGPRVDANDLTTRLYYAADDASCASAPTTCPHRKGDLWKLTNALGQTTEFLSYDGAGRVLRQKDANGVITDLSYHPRGWLSSRTVHANSDGSANALLDAVTRLEYEPYGDIKRVIQPDNSGLEYCRDQAHRITAVAPTTLALPTRCNGAAPIADVEAIVYTLDAAGNRTKEEVRDGSGNLKRVLARQYNNLSQLRALVNAPFASQPDLDLVTTKTTYTYDANGNQDLTTDPLSRQADNDYDPLNRLIQSVQDKDTANATGEIQVTTKYEYDARDNLRKVIDPKGLVTEYGYDGLNNQTQLVSRDTGTTNFSADRAGNRSSQTDARGVISDYGYDALNRLTRISTQAESSRDVGFYYDTAQSDCSSDESYATGRLTRITDASGETRMCYDHRGNLRRKVQITGDQTLVIQYRYNVADRLIGITYPSGVVVDYGRDAQGRITQVTVDDSITSLPVVTNVSYLPFGPVDTIGFGNGQTLSKSWDQNYWPQAIGGSALDYGFSTNVVGNITQVASVTEGSQTLGYDRLDRLNEVRDQNNALIESYSYDATGNRTQQIIGAQTTAYDYPLDSHRLTAVGGAPRTYDAVGNTLTGIPSVPFGAPAAYDVRNRLAGYSDVADRFDMTLSYNGRGERVARAVNRTGMPGELDGFYYNESGQLLGRQRGDEQSGGTVINEEIVWLDQTPVARVWVEDGSIAQVHAIHSDHLNTPRALANAQAQANQASGTIVWRWKLNQQTPTGSNAFGAQAATEDPDNNGTLIKFDLRFPGQQYDAATGLHYNYFRDYEASTGRYVESDPVGLESGPSTFSYGATAPLKMVDPLGLAHVSSPEVGQDSQLLLALVEAREKLRKCELGDCFPGLENYYFSREDRDRVLNNLLRADIRVDPLLRGCGKVRESEPGVIYVASRALQGRCCSLASTLAHEANHMNSFSVGHRGSEERSYYLEDRCFGCVGYGARQ